MFNKTSLLETNFTFGKASVTVAFSEELHQNCTPLIRSILLANFTEDPNPDDNLMLDKVSAA